MKKNKIILIVTGLSFLVSFGLESIKAFADNSYGRLENRLIFDMNFDKDIKNEVNNKLYKPTTNEYIIPSSIKGKGYQPNQSRIVIPASDLNVSNEETITVSFMYKWGGSDSVQMLCSFGYYDIYRDGSQLGFNSGHGDMWGTRINENDFEDEYISIVAEFNKRDMTKNKLYINGEKQSMSYLNSNRPSQDRLNNSFADNFNIGGWVAHNEPYMIDDDTVLDEFKIYRGGIIDQQANDLANSHRIPKLYVNKDSNGVNLNWATEILPEDILLKYDFENGEKLPSFSSSPNIVGDLTGGQKLQQTHVYSGEQGIFTPKTVGGMGNHYQFPATQSNSSIMSFARLYFANGTKLSSSVRLNNPSNENTRFGIIGDGGWGDSLIDLSPRIVETSRAGSTTLKVDRLDSTIAIGKYITSDRTTKYGAEYCKQIRSITNNPDGTYTLHVNGAFEFEQKKGDNVHSRPWRGAWSFPYVYNSSTEDFQLYNLNTTVNDFFDYDVLDRGGSFYITTLNNGDSYIDDLKFGYATEVEVFRDDVSLYKGYGSEFKDTYATDKTAPNNIDESSTNIEMSLNSNDIRNVKISFVAPADGGNSYSYQARAITKSGEPTPKTKPISINQTSGVKGYSYVIDKSPSTNPDNTVDTTSTSINKSFDKEESGLYYLHIKPIDNKGNIGLTSHIEIDLPMLTTTPIIKENAINLDWALNNESEKTYKAYKKVENGEYQSISLTDLSGKTKVRVLNLYPLGGDIETYTTWDNEVISLPKAASLKRWMEEPNNEHSKGYGQGVIEVTPVKLADFNTSPNSYLKNQNSDWNYDVVMVGSYDCNGACNIDGDLSVQSASSLREFITAGKGVLLGHDTAYYNEVHKNLNSLMDLFNMKIGHGIHTPTVPSGVAGTTININKKGLLTNYPWNIGEVNQNLTIPHTHTTGQLTKGDIWMNFNAPSLDYDGGYKSNFYLTTWSNTGYILTGHSNGAATSDEQKLIANTLFYLNQLATKSDFLDKSSQDLKAPTMPTIKSSSLWNSLTFSISESIDKGSTYEYYIESENKNGREKTISNIKEETITTGVKGYSYIVDTSPTTIPDNTVDTTKTTITTSYPANQENVYIHIKAIDNVGNESETHHYKLPDTKKPVVSINGANKNWTNANQNITITATDEGSGVNKIEYNLTGAAKKDWGAYSNGFTISNEGITYISARAYDNMGNLSNEIKVAVKIDKTKPINNDIHINLS